jgi:predicted nucleic acid-binding protein
MKLSYVVDASVALKWFLVEEYSEAASRLHFLRAGLHAPDFFLLEFGHVLCKKHRRREISVEESLEILLEVQRMPMQRHRDAALFTEACAIALERNCGLYDSIYVALALKLNCRMVTADRRLIKSLEKSRFGAFVLWVGDLPEA